MADNIQATPRNPIGGLFSDAYKWMQSPERTQQMQGFAGLLSTTGIPQTIERLSYGEPLTNIGQANVPLLKPETADALMTVAPITGDVAKGVGRLAGSAINDAMVYGSGPLAAITPQPMRMMLGKTAEGMAPLVQKAQQLASQGYPEYKITELTGLEKVPTPKGFDWGKQILDTGAVLNQQAFDNLKIMNGTPLSSVLDHPELFKAYPDLKDLKVEELSILFRGPNTSGLYSPAQDVIELSKHASWGDAKYKDALSTLLHEVQHSIQKREQWPGGTNPGQFTPESSKRIKTSLYKLEDNLAKEASLLSGNNVSRNTISNVLNYLEGNTKILTKQDSALLESLKGNKDLGAVVNRFQSFDGIRERLKARDVKAMGEYNKAASEVQSRAIQKQFEQGTMTVPLTKRPEYTEIQGPLNYTDPMGFTIK
jgi:hypothetical protein